MTAMQDVSYRIVAGTHSDQLLIKSKINVANHSIYTYTMLHALNKCFLKATGFKLWTMLQIVHTS